MANPNLASDIAAIRATKGVVESATVFINGTAARIRAAIDEALANGATADELVPLSTAVDEMEAKAAELSSAIAANP